MIVSRVVNCVVNCGGRLGDWRSGELDRLLAKENAVTCEGFSVRCSRVHYLKVSYRIGTVSDLYHTSR